MTAPTFSSADEALNLVTSAMEYLAHADPTQMATERQAYFLHRLEKAGAMGTATRASILGAFTANQGYIEDGQYSARVWLMRQLRISRGEAAGLVGWSKRVEAHPQI